MLNEKLFKSEVLALGDYMQKNLRGELDPKVEKSVIKELTDIFETMGGRYADMAASGSDFPAQPGIVDFTPDERSFRALEDLIDRMELDFAQKFAADMRHGIDKDIEIGRIKIAFLDGIRRRLQKSVH